MFNLSKCDGIKTQRWRGEATLGVSATLETVKACDVTSQYVAYQL